MAKSGDLKLLSILMMLHRKLCSISEKYQSFFTAHDMWLLLHPPDFKLNFSVIDTVQSEKDLLQVHMTLCWVPVVCSGHMCGTFTERYCLLLHNDWIYLENASTCLVFRNFVNMVVLSFFSKRSLWLGFSVFRCVVRRRSAGCCRRFGITYRPYHPKWSSDIP
jgi:hypothetical protein